MELGRRLRGAVRRRSNMLVPLVVAAVLRVPGVFNGLPYVRHPDEPLNYRVVHVMVRNRRLTPGFYDYPSLSYDIQAIAHTIVAGLRHLGGSSADAVSGMGIVPGWLGGRLVMNDTAWIVSRMLVVIFSLIGVAAVTHIATLLCRSRRWGAVAGVFAAVSSLNVASGFIVTPDALAGTTATVFVAALVSWYAAGDDERPLRRVVVLGVLLGLAVGAKYNNGLLVAALALTVLLLPAERRPSWRRLATLAGVATVTFLITTPAAFLHPLTFIDSLQGVADHYSSGHTGAEGDALSANLRALKNSDAVACAGAVIAVILVRRRTTWILAGWLALYFAVLSAPEVHFDRNLLPILGTIAVLGALGWQQVWHRVRAMAHERRWQPGVEVALVAVVAVLFVPLAGWQAVRTVDELDHQLTDYQQQSRDWLNEQLEPGEFVMIESYVPWIDGTRYHITGSLSMITQTDEQIGDHTALVISAWSTGIYDREADEYPTQAARLAQLRAESCDIRRFEDDWGFWIEVLDRDCDA